MSGALRLLATEQANDASPARNRLARKGKCKLQRQRCGSACRTENHFQKRDAVEAAECSGGDVKCGTAGSNAATFTRATATRLRWRYLYYMTHAVTQKTRQRRATCSRYMHGHALIAHPAYHSEPPPRPPHASRFTVACTETAVPQRAKRCHD
jgi:hypothetical protein